MQVIRIVKPDFRASKQISQFRREERVRNLRIALSWKICHRRFSFLLFSRSFAPFWPSISKEVFWSFFSLFPKKNFRRSEGWVGGRRTGRLSLVDPAAFRIVRNCLVRFWVVRSCLVRFWVVRDRRSLRSRGSRSRRCRRLNSAQSRTRQIHQDQFHSWMDKKTKFDFIWILYVPHFQKKNLTNFKKV